MKSSTETLIIALRVLATDIQSEDGVANATIAEAANRLEELVKDKARLDWLDQPGGFVRLHDYFTNRYPAFKNFPCREVIDVAMQSSK